MIKKANIGNTHEVTELAQELRTIIEKEIRPLEDGIMRARARNHEYDGAADRLLPRLSERNDIIRLNTLKWVIQEIEKLENKRSIASR